MSRASALMLVPAAGAGSRLHSPLPKLLTGVAGRPMIDHLFDLYEHVAQRLLFVVSPGVEREVVQRGLARGLDVECHVQQSPTGMLDAILIPLERVRVLRPEWVWITWCDQLAILPETVAGLQRLLDEPPLPQLALATCPRPDPYIHLERDADGAICAVRHRREGDAMPAHGESDAGLFVLGCEAYTEHLPRFAEEASRGATTGERNFLPFVAWFSRQFPRATRTFRCRETIESVGVNTPDELRLVEAHLLARLP